MSVWFTRSVLAGSGAILGIIGAAMMLRPRAFLATSEIFISSDPGLVSELTAPSGILVIAGGIMFLGALRERFAQLTLRIGAIVYGSYGVGRLGGMALHCNPSQALIGATVIELGMAILLVTMLLFSTIPNKPQRG